MEFATVSLIVTFAQMWGIEQADNRDNEDVLYHAAWYSELPETSGTGSDFFGV